MINLVNFVLPVWAKYVAGALLVAAVWGHGYTKGMERAYNTQLNEVTKIVYKQGKTTTKVVTKYIKQATEVEKKAEEIKHEGQAYPIKFPDDDYVFNNYFVRVFNESIGKSFPSLSSGADADPSGVGVSEVLDVSINNNTAGLIWELRAKSCEEWAKKQEEESVK
jgi:hypothetical protein